MQKRKIDGEWAIELTKPERKKLAEAMAVLTDLVELDQHVASVRDGLRSIIGCVNDGGVYSEAVPETEAAT